MLRPLLFAVAVIAIVGPAPAAPVQVTELTGNWILSSVGPGGESAQCILKLESKDDKPAATVVFSPEGMELSVGSIATTKDGITVTIKQTRRLVDSRTRKEVKSSAEQTFVGVRGQDPKVILGSTGNERIRSRAKLTATDKESLGKDDLFARAPMPEPMTKIQQLSAKVSAIQRKGALEKDAEKRRELQQEYSAALRDMNEKAGELYREVIEKHSESPAALDAGLTVLRGAARNKLTAEDAARFVAVVQKHADPYGPLFAGVSLAPVAEILAAQKGLEAVAIAAIEPAAKAMIDDHPASIQSAVLSAYRTALAKAGKSSEAKEIAARVAGLEIKLDAEYLKSVPPFKPTTFAGRKDPSANRVVMMELFTGAQCPPCVAADVAFDALVKAYKPTDLVLVQYHMHIPGSDPMTNRDTIARWEYYQKLFPYDREKRTGVGGVPTSLFNGKPGGGTGGAMSASESKHRQYTEVINPLLEESSAVKLAGKAGRAGDKLDIAVEVTDADSTDLKLRLLVVEETVKYAGSNGIRFHHQVVRAMPGGADGIEVKDKSFKHTASIDLAEVRAGLTKYLDEYVAENPNRPFARPDRPLDMKEVRVVALVQNDKTGEIVQAMQLDIRGATAGGGGQ
jgi:hypothetical protein